MQTFRQVYRTHGRTTTNFNTSAIQDNSVVLVTASEMTSVGSDPHHRFVGDANVWVSNIAPHGPPFDPNNGVTFVLNVDWGNDLDILVDITVLDSPVVYESA